jgi:hypothetical protein
MEMADAVLATVWLTKAWSVLASGRFTHQGQDHAALQLFQENCWNELPRCSFYWQAKPLRITAPSDRLYRSVSHLSLEIIFIDREANRR